MSLPSRLLWQESCEKGSSHKQLLKVMSFNVWQDRGEPLQRICRIIQRQQPDLVGLQECTLAAAEFIAYECNLHCAGAPDRQQPVLSRWPVKSSLGAQLLHGRGYKVQLPGGHELLWYNLHLPSYPFAPYALHGCSPHLPDPWEDPFEAMQECEPEELERREAAVLVEQKAQLPGLMEVLNDMKTCCDQGLVLCTGDFNAASHLDKPAAGNEETPEWPCSLACASYGLTDSYAEACQRGRAVLEPSVTWAAKAEQEPNGIHSRIDFVYYGGGLDVESSMHLDGSNSGVPDWPSDHRAVLSALSYTYVAGTGP